MYKMKARSCFIFLLALCCVVVTTSTSKADDWVKNLTVNRVGVHDDCYVIDTNASQADCEVPGRFAIKTNAVNAKEIYATALTAFLTGKRVDIYVNANKECLKGGIVSILIEIH